MKDYLPDDFESDDDKVKYTLTLKAVFSLPSPEMRAQEFISVQVSEANYNTHETAT